MPKTRFILTAIFATILLLSPNFLKAQIPPNEYVFDSDYPFPNIEQLCFEENFNERIKVTAHLDVTTLTLLEKLKFQVKTLNQSQREYKKSNGYPVKETTIRSWSKFFPKWYTSPDKFKVDETGTYSYFLTDNRLIPGGWVGSAGYRPQIGMYAISEIEREKRYYHVPFSTMGQEAYSLHRDMVEIEGLLYKYRWSYPSLTVRMELMRQGYNVSVNSRIIKASNNEMAITYYLEDAVIVLEFFENQRLIKKISTYYSYYESIRQYIISKTVEINYETFENRDCYEVVMETSYENFDFTCDKEDEETESRNKSDLKVSNFSVFPNPASNMLNIHIPLYDGMSHIQIINAMGQEMNDLHINSYQTEAQIDLYSMPPGVYFINLIQDDKTYAKKFVKQ